VRQRAADQSAHVPANLPTAVAHARLVPPIEWLGGCRHDFARPARARSSS
jgi:hypothetical protein